MRLQRNALAALVLGVILTVPFGSVSAQPPATSGTVDIKAEGAKPKAAEPAGLTQPKVINHRDPFVKGQAMPDTTKTVTTKSTTTIVAKNANAGKGAKGAAPKAPEPVVPPPQVTIHGIITSGSGNRAILASPNQTYIVRAGDKLGDYRVDSVQAKQVVFRYKDKTFKIKLEDEFGAVAGAGKPSGGKKK